MIVGHKVQCFGNLTFISTKPRPDRLRVWPKWYTPVCGSSGSPDVSGHGINAKVIRV